MTKRGGAFYIAVFKEKAMKKSYEVTILNHRFTVKSEEDEKYVKKVADYVNKKMHEIVSGQKVVSTVNVAILAALNIAGDLFKQKRESDTQTLKWVERVKAILVRVEQEESGSLNSS